MIRYITDETIEAYYQAVLEAAACQAPAPNRFMWSIPR